MIAIQGNAKIALPARFHIIFFKWHSLLTRIRNMINFRHLGIQCMVPKIESEADLLWTNLDFSNYFIHLISPIFPKINAK